MKQFIVIVFYLYTLIANAENYSITKPGAWEVERTVDAIEKLYGKKMMEKDSRVKVVLPKYTSYGGSVPLSISTDIPAKSIAVLQDANPRALVAVFSVNNNPKPSYSIMIKMRQTAFITIVVEGKDGKLYFHEQELEVSSSPICGSGYGVKKSIYASGAWERSLDKFDSVEDMQKLVE